MNNSQILCNRFMETLNPQQKKRARFLNVAFFLSETKINQVVVERFKEQRFDILQTVGSQYEEDIAFDDIVTWYSKYDYMKALERRNDHRKGQCLSLCSWVRMFWNLNMEMTLTCLMNSLVNRWLYMDYNGMVKVTNKGMDIYCPFMYSNLRRNNKFVIEYDMTGIEFFIM